MTDDTTAREVLREVQWVHDGDFGASFCPICCAKKPTHIDDCRLAAALRDPVPSQAVAIRNDTLEEAARAADSFRDEFAPYGIDATAAEIAAGIRALKSTPADQNTVPAELRGEA